jgi:hypothetical protein
LAAIAAYGVVGYKIFELSPGEALSVEERLVFSFALVIAVLALGGVEWASPEENGAMTHRTKISIRAISAIILVALAFIGAYMAAGAFVILITLVFFVQVLLDVRSRVQSNPVYANEGTGT